MSDKTASSSPITLRLAIIGARGVPANYGGFDTLVEELSLGLVRDHGLEVTVYCRSDYYEKRPPFVGGVRCVYIPSTRIKGFESLFHTFCCAVHAFFAPFDIYFVVDPGNAPVVVLLRLGGKKTAIHTDGLGWKRTKWGRLARRYYRWVEWLAAKGVRQIVTDNPAMQEYYRREYGTDSICIAYGSEDRYGLDPTVYGEVGVTAERYLLVVARLERENNTDIVIREYVAARVEMPLVIVGDAPYGDEYLKELHRLADEKVIFAGRVNDQGKLNALYRGAYLYLHGHEVGGTNPSLLRAMGLGTVPLAVDVDFNRRVVGEQGYFFRKDPGDLAGMLSRLVATPGEVARIRSGIGEWTRSRYSWKEVVARYADYFRELAVLR
ncbi:MAG: DUF1972 domain-containing protein [Syntrophobacterales bacterium]|nr:DUF1972 domain-containing protein [Syntrophobacterales bacterium]